MVVESGGFVGEYGYYCEWVVFVVGCDWVLLFWGWGGKFGVVVEFDFVFVGVVVGWGGLGLGVELFVEIVVVFCWWGWDGG